MTDFERARLQAATSFLQTVVLLDDRAAFASLDGGRSDQGDLGEDAPIIDPDNFDEVAAPSPAVEPQAASLVRPAEQGLDAGLITKGFAAKGLVCAVLRPMPGNDLEQETLMAARRADIVVLDWEMADIGQKATEIVRHLYDDDVKNGGRLRLISIYTGHSPLSNVYSALKSSLDGFAPPERMRDGDLVLEGQGHCRIVILAKSESPDTPKDKRFVFNEAQLPDKLIKEFASFAGGLLPNTTLATIAALRANTHRMLARLDKTLDGPLITHNILIGEDVGVDDYVAAIIMEEFESQTSPASIARAYAGKSSINSYFEHHMSKSRLIPKIRLEPELEKSKHDLTLEDVKSLVNVGIDGLEPQTNAVISNLDPGSASNYKDRLKGSLHKRLYLLTGEDESQRRKRHEKFALITGMRRDKSTSKEDDVSTHPILKLGSVLFHQESYWVCLTPICDCVRIPEEGGAFLLGEMIESNDDWNVVVERNGEYVKLLVRRKRQAVKSVFFGPPVDGLIRPTHIDGKIAFTLIPGHRLNPGQTSDYYEWLGEMKPMQAQRMVQNFASNISRVGLDEFEWQRLHAPPA